MVQYIDSFVEVLRNLENNKIDYMVVGSLAAMIYGDPRGIVAETSLDHKYLGGWIAKLGLQQEWQKAQ
ncbi:MAG: hypothetical protein AABY53_08410 [Bdellovibrionota bacterium]